MNKVIDFDAYLSEVNKEEIEIIFKGKSYFISDSPPARLVLDIVKIGNKHGAKHKFTQEEMTGFAGLIFGAKIFDDIANDGMDLDDLMVLVEKIYDMYFNTEKK